MPAFVTPLASGSGADSRVSFISLLPTIEARAGPRSDDCAVTTTARTP